MLRMDMVDFIAAILGGNILTAMFVYGAVNFTKKEKQGEWSWFDWGMIAFPIGFLVLALVSTEGLPPFLDAVASLQFD